MKNPDEAIEKYQLAKKDREYLERMRHIGNHMPGLLTCDDGTRWHPVELLPLVDEVERLRGVVEFQKAAWASDLAELEATRAALFQMQEAAKDLARQLEAGRQAEREECAKVCEGRIGGAVQDDQWWFGFKAAMQQCASAIRARGNSK